MSQDSVEKEDARTTKTRFGDATPSCSTALYTKRRQGSDSGTGALWRIIQGFSTEWIQCWVWCFSFPSPVLLLGFRA
ncbi:unnamed protein product [Fusarium graminearum]|uniref:Uncharacterized protein n=1 Tax=Gibberella zeae TaxID=5518 RepID=A0A4E9DSP0_GIBZA|nr:unnamed protein product [Fusarium graminearum]